MGTAAWPVLRVQGLTPPAGAVQAGETFEEAAVRETAEKAGFTVEAAFSDYVSDGFAPMVQEYLDGECPCPAEQPRTQIEASVPAHARLAANLAVTHAALGEDKTARRVEMQHSHEFTAYRILATGSR
jgi:ADP-ribose pyrophosphatase YjhB (NUDIX family)